MRLCKANKMLLKGFYKKPDIDDYMRNIKPIFQEIMEKEPEEHREQKIRNMLYDVKAAEHRPSAMLFIPLAYAVVMGAISVLAISSSDVQKDGIGLLLLIVGTIIGILALWHMDKQDYPRKILMLFLEEQLLEMQKPKGK